MVVSVVQFAFEWVSERVNERRSLTDEGTNITWKWFEELGISIIHIRGLGLQMFCSLFWS